MTETSQFHPIINGADKLNGKPSSSIKKRFTVDDSEDESPVKRRRMSDIENGGNDSSKTHPQTSREPLNVVDHGNPLPISMASSDLSSSKHITAKDANSPSSQNGVHQPYGPKTSVQGGPRHQPSPQEITRIKRGTETQFFDRLDSHNILQKRTGPALIHHRSSNHGSNKTVQYSSRHPTQLPTTTKNPYAASSEDPFYDAGMAAKQRHAGRGIKHPGISPAIPVGPTRAFLEAERKDGKVMIFKRKDMMRR
jgi:hypothetical protein